MPVQCAKCGEELMGSVNRCWRCGQEFVARSGDADLPPIRRSPVVRATADVWVADLSEAIPTTMDFPVVRNPVGDDRATDAGRAANTVRRGSPFSDRGTATLETIDPESARRKEEETLDREAKYRKNGGAAAGAALAVPLGLISLVLAFQLPLAGFPLALVGLGFGVWGLSSRRRGWALAGLVLGCLSLSIATFYGSVELYTIIYGISPWESDASLP